jgi:hypothetical protein
MRTRTILVATILLFAALPAQAQGPLPAHQWSHCATLTGSGGVATGSDHTGATLGGAIGWEITPRLALEGSATWFDKQIGSTAFAAGLSVRALVTESSWLAPFVEGGFGLYAASFDPNRATDIPSFYASRMSGTITNWFTDPAFFVGAGVDLMRRSNFAVRPTAGAIVAVRDGDAYTVGTFAVRIEYHFGGLPPAPFK